MIKQGTDAEILFLNGSNETLFDSDGQSSEYTLSVVQLAAAPAARSFKVVSTGTSGVGPYTAKRIISATITEDGVKGPPNAGDLRVKTVYDP
jgi:hypothetical protein